MKVDESQYRGILTAVCAAVNQLQGRCYFSFSGVHSDILISLCLRAVRNRHVSLPKMRLGEPRLRGILHELR